MTVTEKFSLMLSSFADIKAAIIEMGGAAGGGYNTYANGVRGIYGGSAAAVTPYPKAGDITEKIKFCETVKEEIRQAIINGGVECDSSVPLSAYAGKIREIDAGGGAQPLEIVTSRLHTTAGASYEGQLEAGGGKPPYKWAALNPALFRTGNLELSENGVVYGTPPYACALNLRVSCTDSSGTTINGKVILRVSPAE